MQEQTPNAASPNPPTDPRRWARLVLPGLLLVGAIFVWRRPRPVPPESPDLLHLGPGELPGPAEVALLSGLKKGDVIGEWTVERILFDRSPNDAPQLALDLVRKGSGITVWIGKRGKVTGAPIETTNYVVSYGHPRPNGEPIPPGADLEVTNKIVERLKANENTAPAPPEL